MSNLTLPEFIAKEDTIPLTIRKDFSIGDGFIKRYGLRFGTDLLGPYNVQYAKRRDVSEMIVDTRENILTMVPFVVGLLDAASLDAAGITPVQGSSPLDLSGRGTLLGFVDTGIDYTSAAFRYEDGTSKIRAIWDQSLEGKAPEGFHFGAEFREAQLTEALAATDPYAVVPHRDTVGHGTFLASIAAGRQSGETIGAAPEADIIAVKLKKAGSFFYERFLIPPQQENAFTSSDVMLGIQYILNIAEELKRPVAICIAVGTNIGSHDGFTVLEEYLTRLSNTIGVTIACAAGNESQTAHHAKGHIAKTGETQSVEFTTGEESGDVYMSVWNGASDRLGVTLTSPAGETLPNIPVRSGSSYTTNLVLEKSRITIEYYLPIFGSGDQLTRIAIVNPTPGIWTLSVRGEIVLDGTFHCWLPMKGFVGPDTQFLTPSPDTTIVTPACAMGITACGAYDAKNGALYSDSSWGPTRLPRMSPDLVAPGVNVAGIYPQGVGLMSGTSVAAAVTAGACALMLQWGIVDGNDVTLTSNRVRANLIRGCIRAEALEYPNTQWGYGELNLYNSLRMMRPN